MKIGSICLFVAYSLTDFSQSERLFRQLLKGATHFRVQLLAVFRPGQVKLSAAHLSRYGFLRELAKFVETIVTRL